MTLTMDVAPAWLDHAKCSQLDEDLADELAGVFFSDKVADIAKAKAICATCPVLAPCLQGALEREEPCGVWGGQLFCDGKIMSAKRNRGRPTKQATAVDAMLPTVVVPDYLQERVMAVTIGQPAKRPAERVAA